MIKNCWVKRDYDSRKWWIRNYRGLRVKSYSEQGVRARREQVVRNYRECGVWSSRE